MHTCLPTGGGSTTGGSGADCKLDLTIVRRNLLSTTDTLGNWTDGRISCRQPTVMISLTSYWSKCTTTRLNNESPHMLSRQYLRSPTCRMIAQRHPPRSATASRTCPWRHSLSIMSSDVMESRVTSSVNKSQLTIMRRLGASDGWTV